MLTCASWSEFARIESHGICVEKFGVTAVDAHQRCVELYGDETMAAVGQFLHHEPLIRAGVVDGLDLAAIELSAAGTAFPDNIPPPRATASRKQLWTPAYAALLPKIANHMVLGGLAKSTSKKYSAAWEQYKLFTANMATDTGVDLPLLLTGANPTADEEHLLHFIAYEGWLMGNKCSTVKGKLNGVRWHHLYAGLPNPLDAKFRVASALRMLKKLRGDSTGKLPVTPEMLRTVNRSLDFQVERDVITYAALQLGFFFMMRSSEYLATGGVFDPTRALTVD